MTCFNIYATMECIEAGPAWRVIRIPGTLPPPDFQSKNSYRYMACTCAISRNYDKTNAILNSLVNRSDFNNFDQLAGCPQIVQIYSRIHRTPDIPPTGQVYSRVHRTPDIPPTDIFQGKISRIIDQSEILFSCNILKDISHWKRFTSIYR